MPPKKVTFSVGGKTVEGTIISNTIDEHENGINSLDIRNLAERGYQSEMNIYDVDPATFGKESFNKAFLGTNKLKVQPDNYPKLPYAPQDVLTFNNSIMVFSHEGKDIGYFSIESLCVKENDKVTSIHFRLMAGFESEWRGKAFFYLPVLEEVVKALEVFKQKFPNENPIVNITQFAMVSAGTPGAINNFADLLRTQYPEIPEFKFGDKMASDLGAMVGLGPFIDQNGISDFKMKVRNKTLNPNHQNEGANRYGFFGLKDGDGITGRQELVDLESLLKIKDKLKITLQNFYNYKSTQDINKNNEEPNYSSNNKRAKL